MIIDHIESSAITGRCAGFDVRKSILERLAFRLLLADHSSIEQIQLVAADHHVRLIRVAVCLQLFQPILQVQERAAEQKGDR